MDIKKKKKILILSKNVKKNYFELLNIYKELIIKLYLKNVN
jgi:hypothetical protein